MIDRFEAASPIESHDIATHDDRGNADAEFAVPTALVLATRLVGIRRNVDTIEMANIGPPPGCPTCAAHGRAPLRPGDPVGLVWTGAAGDEFDALYNLAS